MRNNASAGQPIGGYGMPSKEISTGYVGLVNTNLSFIEEPIYNMKE
jgi:hypothetical protein